MMLTEIEQRKIWVAGSIEKLAGLGCFKYTAWKFDPDFIDVYWKLDDNRHELITSGEEVFNILLELFPNLSLFDITEVFDLLDAYKNSRTKVFAHGMRNLVSA